MNNITNLRDALLVAATLSSGALLQLILLWPRLLQLAWNDDPWLQLTCRDGIDRSQLVMNVYILFGPLRLLHLYSFTT